MAENAVHPTFFNPFMLWTDLAMKTTDMMISSGQNLGERVDEFARAGANPSEQDFRQLTLLAPERVKNATETGFEMVTRLQNTGLQLMSRAWQQWFSAVAAMATMTGSRTFGQALERQDRLFQSLTETGRKMVPTMTEAVSDATPKPRRASGATANAKRSSRVSRTRVAAKRR